MAAGRPDALPTESRREMFVPPRPNADMRRMQRAAQYKMCFVADCKIASHRVRFRQTNVQSGGAMRPGVINRACVSGTSHILGSIRVRITAYTRHHKEQLNVRQDR
jgi:hypothetical protein